MDLDALVPRTAADWLAFAAACLFVIIGVTVISRPETAELRLAALGWPSWPAKLLGLAQIAGGVMLLLRSARIAGAILLGALSAGQLVAYVLYREPDSVLQAVCQLTLVAGILFLEHRRGTAD